ncbi:MAG: hypothetical protein H0S85_00130 [Desulfovibrionaceae bacterium]|jgi:hypothetical protein|nr:hypothetical protein [Desulfovibrionaceae bacterium]
MDILSSLYIALDTALIAPYRLTGSSVAGFWLGTAVLDVWCVLLGELTMAGVYLWNWRHYDSQNRAMVRMHNISVRAIAMGDKTAYKAGNKLANEEFGKCFFAQMALFATSLWPMPFALGWLATRFSGVDIHLAGSFDVGYAFVCIGLYIPLRIAFSRVKTRLSLFRRVAEKMECAADAGKDMVSWSDIGASDAPEGAGKPDGSGATGSNATGSNVPGTNALGTNALGPSAARSSAVDPDAAGRDVSDPARA